MLLFSMEENDVACMVCWDIAFECNMCQSSIPFSR